MVCEQWYGFAVDLTVGAEPTQAFGSSLKRLFLISRPKFVVVIDIGIGGKQASGAW